MNPEHKPLNGNEGKIISEIKNIAEENRKLNRKDAEKITEVMEGASVDSLQEVFDFMPADAKNRLFMAVEKAKNKTVDSVVHH